MAMFPPRLPHVFIRWLSEPGDVVYDPFSGRGTTTFEACLQGRIGFGSDANPLAWILTAAKAEPPTVQKLHARLNELQRTRQYGDLRTVPAAIRVLFHQETLAQLLWLRSVLDLRRGTDRFLMAVLLGGLHANADSQGRPRGLTVAMPNTFAMAPRYVARYITRHHLRAPRVDVLSFLTNRIRPFLPLDADFRPGRAWQQDVRTLPKWPKNSQLAKLVFTSPPYLGVMRYAKLNWIRHWLIGTDPQDVDAKLFSSGSLGRYTAFIQAALCHFRQVMREDGFACLVIGDVSQKHRETRLADIVAGVCTSGTDLKVLGVVEDRLPIQNKVSRIWGRTKGRATKTDRILILGAARARLPRQLPAISWCST